MILASSLPGVPPPVDQIGARCEAPVYASDQLICSDPELRAIDRENVRRSAALQRLTVAEGGLMETNEIWFRRRSRCAFEVSHRACLLDAYRDRASVLNVADAARAAAQPTRCTGNWARKSLHIAIAGNGAIVLTDTGENFAVATPTIKNSVWKPAVAFRRDGRTLVFEPLGAAAIKCTLKR